MPELVSIPISYFEIAITYLRPEIKLWLDRAEIVQAMYETFAPWEGKIDDIEPQTTGKPSEQGVKFNLPNKKISFFFGAASCKFSKDAATWATAGETITILDSALSTLTRITNVKLGKQATSLALHLQPKTLSNKDLIRPFLDERLAMLENTPVTAMAHIARWGNRRVTIDGSAALANAVFLHLERDFEAPINYQTIRDQILADELAVFKMLDVEEELP